MKTPWSIRRDMVRNEAMAKAISKRPGFKKRQEDNAYLEMSFEGRRFSPKAIKELREVEAEAKAAADAWSDSEESEHLMGENVVK